MIRLQHDQHMKQYFNEIAKRNQKAVHWFTPGLGYGWKLFQVDDDGWIEGEA